MNIRDLTPEEMANIESQMRAYRLPLFTRIFKKVWFYFLRYSFLPAFIFLVILFCVYSSIPYWTYVSDKIWFVCKLIVFFYIFGVGGCALISHICEYLSTNRLRKKLGLTQYEFQYFVVIYQIKG
jgi:hypothetical protein